MSRFPSNNDHGSHIHNQSFRRLTNIRMNSCHLSLPNSVSTGPLISNDGTNLRNHEVIAMPFPAARHQQNITLNDLNNQMSSSMQFSANLHPSIANNNHPLSFSSAFDKQASSSSSQKQMNSLIQYQQLLMEQHQRRRSSLSSDVMNQRQRSSISSVAMNLHDFQGVQELNDPRQLLMEHNQRRRSSLSSDLMNQRQRLSLSSNVINSQNLQEYQPSNQGVDQKNSIDTAARGRTEEAEKAEEELLMNLLISRRQQRNKRRSSCSDAVPTQKHTLISNNSSVESRKFPMANDLLRLQVMKQTTENPDSMRSEQLKNTRKSLLPPSSIFRVGKQELFGGGASDLRNQSPNNYNVQDNCASSHRGINMDSKIARSAMNNFGICSSANGSNTALVSTGIRNPAMSTSAMLLHSKVQMHKRRHNEIMKSSLGIDALEKIDTTKYFHQNRMVDARLPNMSKNATNPCATLKKRSYESIILEKATAVYNLDNSMLANSNGFANISKKSQNLISSQQEDFTLPASFVKRNKR